jgi:exopolysaccharide production protein ExoQ
LNTISSSERPISQLAVTWPLMVPLVYFASQGLLWFQSVASNNSLSAGYGTLATGSMTEGNIVAAISVFTIASMVLLPRLPPILSLCGDVKSFVLMCVFAMASCFWSQFPIKSLEWSLCLVGNTLFAVYLFQRFRFERLLKLLIVLGWICLVSSIILCLFFPRYGLDQAGGSVGAWRGMYPHKNSCSMMTVFLLSPVFYVATNSFFARCFRALYTGLSIVVVILSQGRTGWVLLACLLTYVYSVRLIQGKRAKLPY